MVRGNVHAAAVDLRGYAADRLIAACAGVSEIIVDVDARASSLRALYNATLAEPVPQGFVDLLGKLSGQGGGP